MLLSAAHSLVRGQCLVSPSRRLPNQAAPRRLRNNCVAKQNRRDGDSAKAREQAISAALQVLTQGAGRMAKAAEDVFLPQDGVLKRLATEASEVLEDLSNPRTGLGKELLADVDTRPAAARAREMILADREERKKTDDLFRKAGIPVTTIDPAALPTLPEMTAAERQGNFASTSGASGPIVVPTTRVPKARPEDLNRAKWNVAVEEAYRSQLEKQQVAEEREIKEIDGSTKPPDMPDAEWDSVVERLKAVEQAIKDQNEQVRQLTLLLQLAEKSGQMDAASKDAAIAALQRVAEVTGKASASQGSVAPPPGAVDQGTVKRDSAVDSDVDKILSSALSELGLDGDGGPDRVVRVTGEELENRLRQWASWEGVDGQPPRGGAPGVD